MFTCTYILLVDIQILKQIVVIVFEALQTSMQIDDVNYKFNCIKGLLNIKQYLTFSN